MIRAPFFPVIGSPRVGAGTLGHPSHSTGSAQPLVSNILLHMLPAGTPGALAYGIDEFLADIGLSQYADVMGREEVTPLVLATLTLPELEVRASLDTCIVGTLMTVFCSTLLGQVAGRLCCAVPALLPWWSPELGVRGGVQRSA